MWKQGQYSAGKLFDGAISPDLCVPLGLIMPNKYDFTLDNEPDANPLQVNAVEDKKMDFLLDLVRYNKQSTKRTTRKNYTKDVKKSKRIL